MSGPSSDRNLLLGILALQMDFISRDALIEAMHDWTLDKSRSLSEILVRQGALEAAERSARESLVERHIARHGGDTEKSLSTLEPVVHTRTVNARVARRSRYSRQPEQGRHHTHDE